MGLFSKVASFFDPLEIANDGEGQNTASPIRRLGFPMGQDGGGDEPLVDALFYRAGTFTRNQST